MHVLCCSSGCCGIKHIRDFPYSPSEGIYIRPTKGHDDDQSSTLPSMQSWEDITHEDVEKLGKSSSSGEYFKFLVTQIKRRRPQGMITVNLAAEFEDGYCCEECNGPRDKWGGEDSYDTEQIDAWRPLLIKEGFTETVFVNSNSGNRVHHFELIYGS